MVGGKPDRTKCRRIGSKAVSHDAGRPESVFLQELDHQFHGVFGVATALDQEIEPLSLVIDGPPNPVLIIADGDHQLVEVPLIAWLRPRAADVSRDDKPELQHPPPMILGGKRWRSNESAFIRSRYRARRARATLLM